MNTTFALNQPVATTTTVSEAAENHSSKIIWVYVAVIAFLLFQTLYTVYHGGLVVGNGYRISQLEKEKREMAQELATLQKTTADANSLVTVKTSDLYTQFQPMAGVVTVDETQAVASR